MTSLAIPNQLEAGNAVQVEDKKREKAGLFKTATVFSRRFPSIRRISRPTPLQSELGLARDVEKGRPPSPSLSAAPTTSGDDSSEKISTQKHQKEPGCSDMKDVTGALSQEKDSNSETVQWNGDDDPAKPVNWSVRRKWTCMTLACVATFMTSFSAGAVAPALPQITQDLHSDDQALAPFLISLSLLGWVFGPILFGPMSEIYGRRSVYLASLLTSTIFSAASALSRNMSTLLAVRFLIGFSSIIPYTLSAGTAADCFRQDQRGGVMSIWTMTGVVGTAMGPIIGGVICTSAGWRWMFWTMTIIYGVVSAVSSHLFHETYPPVLLERKAQRLRKETGDVNLHVDQGGTKTPRELFLLAIVRPFKFLFRMPIVFCLCILVAVTYANSYLLIATLALVMFDVYQFNATALGLSYLGVAIGALIGSFTFGAISDRLMKRLAKGGEMKPEYRLLLLLPASIVYPAGLILYGWTAQYHGPWILPIIGTAMMGVGTMFCLLPVTLYIMDAWPLYAASGAAAMNVLRCLAGTFLPLAAPAMYDKLGYGWGNTLLAAVAIAFIPLVVFLIKKGEWLRKHPRFQIEL